MELLLLLTGDPGLVILVVALLVALVDTNRLLVTLVVLADTYAGALVVGAVARPVILLMHNAVANVGRLIRRVGRPFSIRIVVLERIMAGTLRLLPPSSSLIPLGLQLQNPWLEWKQVRRQARSIPE